jgi:hypothetical protein
VKNEGGFSLFGLGELTDDACLPQAGITDFFRSLNLHKILQKQMQDFLP